ncbi:MAG: hypothetical protein ACYC5U_07055 [Rhodocyclaceae bacterium]
MTSDSKYEHWDYCRDVVSGRVAADVPMQLKCANDLNNRLVEKDGAVTLANLIYWLQIEKEWDLEKKGMVLGTATRHASVQFHSRVLADIRSGKLIVRNITHLIPVNDAADVQAAINDEVFSQVFAEMSTRVVVKKDEARSWLEGIGVVALPEWLIEKEKSDATKRNKKTPLAFEKALYLLFDEITKRAKKDGKNFDRFNAPGIAQDLLAVASKFNTVLDCELNTFFDYRKSHCKFRGRKPGKCTFYRDLFPEYFR